MAVLAVVVSQVIQIHNQASTANAEHLAYRILIVGWQSLCGNASGDPFKCVAGSSIANLIVQKVVQRCNERVLDVFQLLLRIVWMLTLLSLLEQITGRSKRVK